MHYLAVALAAQQIYRVVVCKQMVTNMAFYALLGVCILLSSLASWLTGLTTAQNTTANQMMLMGIFPVIFELWVLNWALKNRPFAPKFSFQIVFDYPPQKIALVFIFFIIALNSLWVPYFAFGTQMWSEPCASGDCSVIEMFVGSKLKNYGVLATTSVLSSYAALFFFLCTVWCVKRLRS